MYQPYKLDLEGKVVVITGGSGVLGSEMSKALAAHKAKVAILGLRQEEADRIAKEIVDQGFIAKGYSANVLDKAAMEEVRKQINEDLGTCDILINGAGGNHPSATTDDEMFDLNNRDVKTFFDLEEEGFKKVFNLNMVGTLIPTQVFAKDMVEKDDASIINISSMNAYTPLTKIPAYSGAKSAVSNFTEWLATYFAKTNIRCNAIAPGFFATKQNEKLLFNEDKSLTARSHKIINSTPMGRFGKPEELLGTLLFLVDKKASGFVTGICIPVDGGFSAYSGV